MGFPWKKVKSTTTISQMVKDQFHHRKNAASPLVVETGFPTSLVDLIVNHRDRFKKDQFHHRKKKKPPPSPPLGTDDPPPLSPSQSLLPPPAPSPTPLGPTSPARSPIPAHESDDGPISVTVSQIDEDFSACAYSNKKFEAVLKIFLVLVLALGAKKFAVGITVSAFVLFFLDYLARNLFKCDHLLPCSKVQENLSLMLLEVQRFIISKIVRLDEEEVHVFNVVPQKDESIEEEIQIVQPSCYLEETDDPSYCGRNIRPEGVKSMAELLEEDEEICELSISKNGKSRRAKIKSKVKKLFPKRIGNSRKTGKGLKRDINPTGEEGEFPIVEENEHTAYPERGLEPEVELTKGVVETSEVSKSDFVRGETNSGYLVLVLVALVGLVMGGRVYALILTLIWCFLSKSGGAIRRSVKDS